MADNSLRLAGATSITVNGTSYKIADDCTWYPGNLKRESLVGLSGYAGYSETPVAAWIKVKLYDAFDISVTDIGNWTNVPVVCEAANGKTISSSSLTCMEPPTVSGKEGSFEVTLEGASVRDN